MASFETKALEKYLDAELRTTEEQRCIPNESKKLRDKYIAQMLKIVELTETYYKIRRHDIDLVTNCPFAIRWKQTQVITYLLLPPNKDGMRMSWQECYYTLLPQLTNISCLHTLKKFKQRDFYLEQFLKVVEHTSTYGENLLRMPYEDAVKHARRVSCRSAVKDKVAMELCIEGKVSTPLSFQRDMALGARFLSLAEAHQTQVDRKNKSVCQRVRIFLIKKISWKWMSRARLKFTKRNS